MSKASGIVGVVSERAGKYGPMYSIKLEGDESWYGTKSTKPNVNQGDAVEFNFSNNARGYPDVDLSSIVVLDAAAAATVASAAPAATATEGRKAFDRKQAVIVYQNAGNRALELIKLANEVGVLDLPSKGTKADKYNALRVFLDMATNDYYYEAMAVYGGQEPGEETDDS